MTHIKLEQDILYVKSWEPFDFQAMGQKAVKVVFTDDSHQFLTTPIDPERGNDKGDFKDEAEMMEFITYLKKEGIPRAY